MKIDENEFFREAALRICGTFEIEEALWNCFKYISKFIKVDRAYLHYFKPEENCGIIFAMADHDRGQRVNIKSFPPPDVCSIMKSVQMPEQLLFNRADEDPMGSYMLSAVGMHEKCSLIVTKLIVDNKWVGGVSFGTFGWDQYNDKDLHLLKLLRTPFTIALSNSKRYYELLELKNLLADDNRYLQDELYKQKNDEIIGHDFGLNTVMQQVYQVAPLSSPVLLLGETGVGKEVLANAIHKLSTRKDGPMIKVNCGAIPETLIDSELFGHEKGAFTGAIERKRGRFERADKGTIFLDEIGELPLEAQIRFLRVLQEKKFEPVGNDRTIKSDIRVIAATHQNLEKMIKEKRFREDLYFRLKVFPIYIPPLRERKMDIPALVQHFILKKYKEMGLKNFPVLANNAIEHLNAYDWPGNVRELENAVERALIISLGKPLRFDDLINPVATSNTEDFKILDRSPVLLDELISQHIKNTLNQTKGKVGGTGGAAELMGINPATLRHKMRKLCIPFGRDVDYP
ncbi:sigma-54-dependent Fis family transcriptional regulator [Desulfobacula sp.]|uniref:sigma-54 interaction domain-containing protein n=1 Tax=Desulfobacula sp. TaxID=2593537 RepID=UPI0025C246E1|nr:sigma-54 dependent transcriptional regulator [Desulfobacula sp.]MBC2704714.1 sigma-54-dependent Fis family transcriptional regulator [Desulfobacula sp.]